MQSVVLAQAVVSGILVGGVYALIAVGFNVILGVLKIPNFAQGDLTMLGMFFTFLMMESWGLDPYATILPLMLIFFLAGLVIYPLLFARTLRLEEEGRLVVTFGLMTVLNNLALLLFGATHRGIQEIAASDAYYQGIVTFGGMAFRLSHLLAFFMAALLVAAIYGIMTHTLLGKRIRAVVDDREAASVIGLSVHYHFMITLGLSFAFAAAAAPLLVPIMTTSAEKGFDFTLLAIIVVILGGLGDFRGCFIGGVLLGLIRVVGQVYMPAALSDAISLLLVLVVLMIRPQGLVSAARLR